MTEKVFERIGQLVAQIVDSRLERIDSRLELIDSRLERIDTRFDEMEAKSSARFEQIEARLANIETFKSEIISEFNHSLGIQSEELSRQFQAAAEGQAGLTERVERLEERVAGDEAKVENLYLQVLAHRHDPDAHRSSEYRVKEVETGFIEVRREKKTEDPKGAEIKRRMDESKRRMDEIIRKHDAVTEEINAYYAANGVEPPKIDYDEESRKSRFNAARYRVEQELKKRREEEKPE